MKIKIKNRSNFILDDVLDIVKKRKKLKKLKSKGGKR